MDTKTEELNEEEKREKILISLGKEKIVDGFNSGGYEWCCDNWGTKWGFVEPRILGEDNGYLRYYFESAWAEPTPLILKMSSLFPTLNFTLELEGEVEEIEETYKFKNGSMYNG